MKLICIADTHNRHQEIPIPDGDILIHAGDFSGTGTKNECINFLTWFSSQPHEHKIFIGGNHDFYLEKMYFTERKSLIPPNINFLQDSGITIKGFNFWGSAVNPGNEQWAFNRQRGREIRRHWDKIPSKTDVLITHTPPYGVKDQLKNKTHLGCEELKKRIDKLKLPLHIFGHIHEHYGKIKISPTTFINASSLDNKYRIFNPPIEIEL